MNCTECGKEIKRKIKPSERKRNKSGNFFCSRNCSSSYNNRGIVRHGNHCNKRCAICDVKLKNCNSICCSNECKGKYTFNKTLLKFKSGKCNKNTTQRKCLIHTKGNICSMCGIEGRWNNKPLVLQVDHIDGNSDNNSPENLRLLCPNCHSQTETFGGSFKVKKNTKRNMYLRKYKGY